MDGDYIDARMIGSLVYMITREQVYTYSGNHVVVPALREGTRTVIQPDVWYFDNREYQYITTITSFDVSSGNEKDAQTYLLGSGNTLYVSRDAMYVSYQRYHPVMYNTRGVVPPQPVAVNGGMGVSTAVDLPVSSASGVSSSKIAVSPAVLPSDFNTLTESERQSILDGPGMPNRRRSAGRKPTRPLRSSTRSALTMVLSPTSQKVRYGYPRQPVLSG